ncbi:tetratricopeptide repeat protein, partial [candidate division WOR-3 bacterium]|nr:tetratricopeptide repeat protein [candidate division WOR-3 bacterium]
ALLSDEDTLEFVCARVRSAQSRHPYTLACEGCRYMFLANFSRAEDLFHMALRSLPGEPDLHIGLATVYSLAGDEDRSADVFRQVLDLDPDNVRALVAMGMAYAMDGDYSNALVEYEKAKQLDPEVENPHQRLGRDYYSAGLFDEAAGEFAVATSEEPDQPAAWFYLMDCYARHGRVDDAIDVYESIRVRFRGRPDLTSGLFEYFRLTPEAIAALEELARRDAKDPDVRVRLSQFYNQAGRPDDALRVAEEAARLDPDDHRAATWLAELYYAAGRYQDTIAACNRAIAISATDQAAYQLKSDALLYLGHGEESLQAITEMERVRERAWQNYQAKFSGTDRPDPAT